MIIYKATNIVNGKYYIGKTKNSLESRIKSHKTASLKKDWLFYRAINKHGFHNFKWEIMVECDNPNQLNELEKKYISENHNGYNIAKGGNGGDTISNNPNLENIKENVSKFHKGKILSDEHKQKISNSHKGKTKNWAKDTAKKMSEANVGKESKLKGTQLSDEHKEKISKGNKGKTKIFTEEHKQNLAKAKEGFKNPNKGKTYEEIMGVEKALEFKKRQSEARKGRVVSEETKKKISECYKNKKNEK
jgi:group I intron endonuclease